ncbi:DoxX family protein [Ramlibacter henchirensis]|uniref:DoxX family protein n=1 Tax=Ramlibacter henchirensis TaxID=204072 RepID=A0A4Z0BS89_9BURK|nr:DoxX family protein [Ramlibacter henchirensis]TFZ02153.1 DoxX family protein [Ramlibacter henchirensis]
MSTTSPNTYGSPAAVGTTSGTQDAASLVGRILLAWLFVPAGYAKIAGFAGTAGYIASKGLPMPELAAALAILVELGLGLLLLVGWQARWAALGLAIFVAVITPLFHNFWAMPEAQQMMQKQAFWKNLAVVGGLLYVYAFGPGGWSLDGRKRR